MSTTLSIFCWTDESGSADIETYLSPNRNYLLSAFFKKKSPWFYKLLILLFFFKLEFIWGRNESQSFKIFYYLSASDKKISKVVFLGLNELFVVLKYWKSLLVIYVLRFP